MARTVRQQLSRGISRNQPVLLHFSEDEQKQVVELPAPAVVLLMDVLEALAAGQGVTTFSENAELTTVQAAQILHVSRPFLIRLLEEKHIPFRKVGAHRRIRLDDVLAYKQEIDRERETILDQLAVEAQEHDLGDGHP